MMWLKAWYPDLSMSTFSAEEVAKHNKEGDVWVIVGDEVGPPFQIFTKN